MFILPNSLIGFRGRWFVNEFIANEGHIPDVCISISHRDADIYVRML